MEVFGRSRSGRERAAPVRRYCCRCGEGWRRSLRELQRRRNRAPAPVRAMRADGDGRERRSRPQAWHGMRCSSSDCSPSAQPPPHAGFLTDLSTVVADVESFDTSASSPKKLATDFRRILTNLGSVSSSLTDACRIQIWKLATRLWNACVDRANSTALSRAPSARAAEAEIRQAAPELLLLAGVRDEIPLAAAEAANFFFRAGKEWLNLGRVDLATACFEKGTPLVSATGSEEERRVLLDLNLARARAASNAGDQSLAVALLSRSKPLAFASPERIKSREYPPAVPARRRILALLLSYAHGS